MPPQKTVPAKTAPKKTAPKKTASKKAAVPTTQIYTLPEIDDLKALSETAVFDFLMWIYSDESEPYYADLSPKGREEFNTVHQQANFTLNSLQNATLARFASRARAQMPRLQAAVDDLKGELDGQKRAAALIGAFGNLLNVLVPILL